MKFDDKYFSDLRFSTDQILRSLKNALRDLEIAQVDKILEVKFNYTYTAFIKAGITLIMLNGKKIRSVPGHHAIIIETMATLLKDDAISDVGNAMRSKRNIDLYSGGTEVSEKECKEYYEFAHHVVQKVKAMVHSTE